MDRLTVQLFEAARKGETAAVRASLAAGADANFLLSNLLNGWGPLHTATLLGNPECMAALIAGGAEVNIFDSRGEGLLHMVADQNMLDCVPLLLAAGADPLAVTSVTGWTPLHHAAESDHSDMTLLLLQAAPAAALAKDASHHTPLAVAIRCGNYSTARCLLEQGPLQPAREVLAALALAQHLDYTDWGQATIAWVQPLYATLVSRQPLTSDEWGQTPNPCPGLGAALPAVLRRSAAEAGHLVRHLPASDRQRLRTTALCLARAQQQAGAPLPTPILWRILAQSALPT